jgi:hypothetical protein
MKSDSGIIYHSPPKALWVPRSCETRPSSLAVRYKTQLCDGQGRVIKDLQSGWNTITDWGMDSLATIEQGALTAYLHLSSALGPAKRVLTGGTTLSLVITDATNIAVTASAGFFIAGDVGNTLSITDLGGAGQTQELKITAYTDSQHVTCATRQSAWLPNFVAGTGPFASAGVHPTSTNVLATQFNKFNTYDTSAPNYRTTLNDSGNSRFIIQSIFLSGAAGSTWTINELGWSDGNGSNNVFGRVNLASPDTVGTGQKYRVTLQLYDAYSPVEIASQSVNWGATIGTYDLHIRQEIVPVSGNNSFNTAVNFLRPKGYGVTTACYSLTAHTLLATKWEGDSGYNQLIITGGVDTGQVVSDSAYTNGTHTKNRTLKWPDTVAITNARVLHACGDNNNTSRSTMTIVPNSGTITKPSGYWCALTFPLYWTRTFVN